PRGQKNLLPKRYSILTIALPDTHHGVTRYPRATGATLLNRGVRRKYDTALVTPEVVGSNPAPATNFQAPTRRNTGRGFSYFS
ncbi:MAG: hypothetical protein KIA58_09930, partial [Winkia neuii]|uniref:hypothetical protein n=1 Tax=Winkia neuii TaxID=33007 RepID=UPI00241CB5A4